MSYTTYLAHHGIKGQKWGIRRTPEQLGHVNGGTPKIYKLRNYKGKLYFISKEEMDGKTLNPRVPDNFLTRNGFEDGTTKRVCFSHDPGKCLTAMSQNVSGQSFNVYEPAEKHDVYKPNNVVVPDADITGEMWIKEPVRLKKVGTIKCTGDTGEAGLPYKYGNNTAELYDWNYEWTSNDEVVHSALSHHGIKGQKWGVRRFQNYDGTRIKNESTQKIKIPKGPYYKWRKERGIRVYDRTKAGNKLFEVMHSTASDVINKLNEDGQMTKTYQDVCKAGWAFTGGVKFNDIRDEYVHAYYDKMERDSTYDYRKCYNSTYDSFQEPNISDKSAFVKILHDAVGKVVTKDVWKEDPNMPSWKESPFYKVQNANPDSTEVQSAYADILKNGKILYEKENRLISLIKKENSRNRLSNDEEQECQELLNDLSYSHGDGRSDFVRPEHSDEWRKHMRDKAYNPGLSEERLFYRIQDPEEVSHSVIVNDDIYSYRSYLAHHGIKGQKWGVRRFQKADGSLTAAGAKRYGIKSAMSAGRKVGSGLVKAARGGIQKAKEVKARKAAEKLERQKKVWAKTRLGLTMNADKFSIEELREANNRLDERDRAARGLAEQVKRGVGYFQAIRDVTGAIKDTKDYIEDISGEKGKKAKAADELKYQRELEKEKRTYERDMVRDKVKADQEYEYKREKDRLDRESKEKIEKMKAKAKKKKDSGGSDPDPEPDEAPKKKASRENTTEFEEVYWNSSKKDREFMETVFPKEVDEAKERKKRRNKARREVDEAIRRMGFFGHSDISTYGGMMSTTVLTASDISAYESYLAHHGIKGQKWGVRRFQNEDGSLTEKGLKRQARRFTRELNRNDKRMASSRAASMMQRRKLDKNSQQIEKATFNGNTRKVAKLEAKRAKIEAKKAKYDAKTKTVNDRQKAIGEACKNLNLDIASKTVNRSGRSRAGKVGVIALGMLTGVISTKSVNGTKYKVRSDPKVRRNGTVRDYSHGENRLTTGLGVLNFKSGNKRYRGGVRGTTRWND